jgi:hypothetical protein
MPPVRRYALDKETPEVRQAHEEGLKDAAFSGAFFQLHTKLTSRLLMSLAGENVAEQEGEMKALKTEISDRVDALKKAPTESSMHELETWAFEKTAEKYRGQVAKAFADLREDLIQQGIDLET